MVSALDSGSSGPGSGPGRGHLGQDTLLSRCLSPPRCINGYRRNAGGNPAMHPIQSTNTPSRFMLQKPEISAGLIAFWLVSGDFTFYIKVYPRQQYRFSNLC